MHIARVQVDELATPVIALGVDGAWYDVAALESLWGVAPASPSTDFHARVIAARCAGLFELDARLRGGPRPSEARLRAEDMLPLPPCDTDRCALLSLAPYAEIAGTPQFVRGDARTLVGDGQPVAQPPEHRPSVQVGLAVVIAEDLWRASAREAARAILGVTLRVDWGAEAPSTLGPALVVGRSLRDVGGLELSLRAGDVQTKAPAGAWPFLPSESLAFISQHAPLRAGDVIGLGGALPLPVPVAYRQRVTATLAPLLSLSGWATVGPPVADWRLR